jgi:K(+)-stimulated pyrophosphate-energized sodium pump
MVVIGLFIGGLVPYLFGAMGMRRSAAPPAAVVDEVRRQFRKCRASWKAARSRTTPRGRHADQGAIKEMIIPSLLPVLCPIVLFFGVNLIGGEPGASRRWAPC